MCRRTSAGDARRSNPAILAEPDVGGRSVVSILIIVLFPAPFAPNRPKIVPDGMARSTPSTATSDPKRRVSFVVSTAGAPMVVDALIQGL